MKLPNQFCLPPYLSLNLTTSSSVIFLKIGAIVPILCPSFKFCSKILGSLLSTIVFNKVSSSYVLFKFNCEYSFALNCGINGSNKHPATLSKLAVRLRIVLVLVAFVLANSHNLTSCRYLLSDEQYSKQVIRACLIRIYSNSSS